MDSGKKFLTGIVFAPIGLWVHGFVLSKLWAWFIASTFAIQELSVIQAVGVAFVIDFILLRIDWKDYSDELDFEKWAGKIVSHTVFAPFVLLGMGWVIKLFM